MLMRLLCKTAIVIILVPANCFAFFCPNNFNQIDLGMNTEQVSQQCGKPDASLTQIVEPEGPQEWNYYVPQTVGAGGAVPVKGTMRVQFTFDSEGKVVNMNVNGIGVGASAACGRSIQLGDSRDTIKAACGSPSFINKSTGDSPALGPPQPKKVITTFTYNTNPPVSLIFENGILREKQ